MSKLKSTVAAQKALLAVKEAQSKASKMEAASNVIFDDDEELDVQASALHGFLLSLEANSVKMGAMAAAEFHCYTLATSIIESGGSTTFVRTKDKLSNALTHKSQLRTANGQKCYTTLAGKTALAIGNNAIHLHALASPTFGEDLISASQLTAKGNKIPFTKTEYLLLGPSAALSEGIIIGTKDSDKLYRLQATPTKPYENQVLRYKLDVPEKSDSSAERTEERKKNGPRVSPIVMGKYTHDTLNRTHRKIIDRFRKEFPGAMQYMENFSRTQSHSSCPPCSDGKATRAPFKQNEQSR